MYDVIAKHLGSAGKMVGASKSDYCRKYPDNTVIFNACIFDSNAQQIWYGDIDLTASADAIRALADEATETLYITPETPWRFGDEGVTIELLRADPKVHIVEKAHVA